MPSELNRLENNGLIFLTLTFTLKCNVQNEENPSWFEKTDALYYIQSPETKHYNQEDTLEIILSSVLVFKDVESESKGHSK